MHETVLLSKAGINLMEYILEFLKIFFPKDPLPAFIELREEQIQSFIRHKMCRTYFAWSQQQSPSPPLITQEFDLHEAIDTTR